MIVSGVIDGVITFAILLINIGTNRDQVVNSSLVVSEDSPVKCRSGIVSFSSADLRAASIAGAASLEHLPINIVLPDRVCKVVARNADLAARAVRLLLVARWARFRAHTLASVLVDDVR